VGSGTLKISSNATQPTPGSANKRKRAAISVSDSLEALEN
jgi:hypothetical protein